MQYSPLSDSNRVIETQSYGNSLVKMTSLLGQWYGRWVPFTLPERFVVCHSISLSIIVSSPIIQHATQNTSILSIGIDDEKMHLVFVLLPVHQNVDNVVKDVLLLNFVIYSSKWDKRRAIAFDCAWKKRRANWKKCTVRFSNDKRCDIILIIRINAFLAMFFSRLMLSCGRLPYKAMNASGFPLSFVATHKRSEIKSNNNIRHMIALKNTMGLGASKWTASIAPIHCMPMPSNERPGASIFATHF